MNDRSIAEGLALNAPRPLPYCSYPTATDIAQHGVQPLPETLPLVNFQRARPHRSRWYAAVPAALALALVGAGAVLDRTAPGLGTGPWQMLVWGFCVSTVVLWHATFTINSLAHRFGSRRYATRDDSRNNSWLALLTLGEGWHNNHHRYPAAARQGFYWWEIDISYLALRALAALGIVWDLQPVPLAIRDSHRAAERGGR